MLNTFSTQLTAGVDEHLNRITVQFNYGKNVRGGQTGRELNHNDLETGRFDARPCHTATLGKSFIHFISF